MRYSYHMNNHARFCSEVFGVPRPVVGSLTTRRGLKSLTQIQIFGRSRYATKKIRKLYVSACVYWSHFFPIVPTMSVNAMLVCKLNKSDLWNRAPLSN